MFCFLWWFLGKKPHQIQNKLTNLSNTQQLVKKNNDWNFMGKKESGCDLIAFDISVENRKNLWALCHLYRDMTVALT